MSDQRVKFGSWEWEKSHKERIARKYQKRETLRALLEMWEARDDADYDYILELRAKLRSVENQLSAMSL